MKLHTDTYLTLGHTCFYLLKLLLIPCTRGLSRSLDSKSIFRFIYVFDSINGRVFKLNLLWYLGQIPIIFYAWLFWSNHPYLIYRHFTNTQIYLCFNENNNFASCARFKQVFGGLIPCLNCLFIFTDYWYDKKRSLMTSTRYNKSVTKLPNKNTNIMNVRKQEWTRLPDCLFLDLLLM